ncbi:hypothetical protein E05_46800 [Plautia stali symbiont]|nr:hypothetical protein E05_46800 [Plautia stali symbiont]
MTIHAPRSGFSRWLKWLLVLLVLLIAAGVIWRVASGKRGAVPGDLPPGGHRGAAQMSGPATLVQSGVAATADVPVYLNALGTVVPNASVTSRVAGQLQQVFFTEGQKVSAGQLLAQIDPRSYQATLAQYQGDLSQNQALLPVRN